MKLVARVIDGVLIPVQSCFHLRIRIRMQLEWYV
jgi:hypothetical protein